jgi:hypothetical protein
MSEQVITYLFYVIAWGVGTYAIVEVVRALRKHK